MSASSTPGNARREVAYASVEQAEAAARDFQRRGYRRRTRGLLPGDVLVERTAAGFSVSWIPRDTASEGTAAGTRRRRRA